MCQTWPWTPISANRALRVNATGRNFPPFTSGVVSFGGVTVASGFNTDSQGSFSVSFITLGGPGGPVEVKAQFSGSEATAPFFLGLQEVNVPFTLQGANSVPFHLFSVITEGTILAEVSWEGASEELDVSLTGRRRPHLADPPAPYAQAAGPSPVSLSHDVTEEDLNRGVGWRLIIKDTSGFGDAQGVIRLLTPVDPQLQPAFQQEKVALRSGEHWPGAELQDDFLAALPPAGLRFLVGPRSSLLATLEPITWPARAATSGDTSRLTSRSRTGYL